MNEGICIAGNLIVDKVKKIDKYPDEGLFASISQSSESIGGCAGNTLCDLAQIDDSIPYICIGRVGDDDGGEFVLKKLKKYNISTDGVSISKTSNTAYTDVMSSRESGERTFFYSGGANAEFSFEHINFNLIKCRMFHFGYALLLDGFDEKDHEYSTVMAKTLSKVRSMGIKTSIDVVSDIPKRCQQIVVPALKYCDYIIINEIEAGNITGIPARDEKNNLISENLRKICGKLIELGVSDLAVIHMPECGCAMDASGEFCIQPSYQIEPSEIKGSVGAGDAFCAGMLYSIYNSWEISDSLKFANMAAACCLMHENSIDGMKSKEEIWNMQSTYKMREKTY
ncbi:MAG: carbohydrate kinase family protein [Eubacteriales bacterium]